MFRPLWSSRGGTAQNPPAFPHRRRRRPRRRARGRVLRRLRRLLLGLGRTERDPRSQGGRTPSSRAKQSLGQTSLLKLGVRNESEDTIPALTFTISVAGKAGEGSTLPFGIRDPQPGLAQPDRPVWVLAEGYPKLAGLVDDRGGAEGAALQDLHLRPAEARRRRPKRVWKLSAPRKGSLPPPLLGRLDRRRQARDPRRRQARRLVRRDDQPGSAGRHRQRQRRSRRNRGTEGRHQVAFLADGRRRPRLLDRHRHRAGRAAVLRRWIGDGAAARRRPSRRPGGRLALKQIGSFDRPGLRRPAPPAIPKLLFVVEQRGQGRGPAQGPPAPPPLPRHLGAGSASAASAACSRSPSRPTTARAGASTSTTRTSGEHQGRRVQAPDADPCGRRLAALR